HTTCSGDWSADVCSSDLVTEAMEHLPAGLMLVQSLPARFGAAEFSLWEAERVDALQQFVDTKLGLVSRSTYFPIDAGNAFGLPQIGSASWREKGGSQRRG